YLPPRLIDRMECDGETIAPESDPVDVASKESSREMVRMLESVVTSDSGTGHNAAVEGYRVAGKTGTAQIPDASGKLNDNTASFALPKLGILPSTEEADPYPLKVE